MLNERDTRIVELEFNNKEFLSKIEATLKALNKLDESLELKNAESGGDAIAAFAKTTEKSMESISESLDSISERFSYLGIVGMTVMQDLTRYAVKTGTKIYNALIGQIIQRGKRRSMNIQKAKFMLEGLGIDWGTISEDINYGVQDTAYGLDAAANAASQLSASGVQLGQDMKTALRGISGVAAMTSRSYEEVAHVFTRVAGNGRAMAIDLNSIAAYGLNAAQALADYFNELYDTSEYTEAQIRDMVSKGQIDFLTFSRAMDTAFGPHAKEANKTFTGSLDNIHAAMGRIGADFADPVYAGMIPIFNGVIKALKLAQAATKPLVGIWKEFFGTVSNVGTNILESEELLETVFRIITDITSVIRPLKNALYSLGFGEYDGILGLIRALNTFLANIEIYGSRAYLLEDIFYAIGDSISTILYLVKDIGYALSPIWNIILGLLNKLTPLTGGINNLSTVIRSINPALRYLNHEFAEILKLGLEYWIGKLVEIASRIDWDAVLDGVTYIVLTAGKLIPILTELAVILIPKIINLIGKIPQIIPLIRQVALIFVASCVTIYDAVTGIVDKIEYKFNSVVRFFTNFINAISNLGNAANRTISESTSQAATSVVNTVSRGAGAVGGFATGGGLGHIGRINLINPIEYFDWTDKAAKAEEVAAIRAARQWYEDLSLFSKMLKEIFEAIGIEENNVTDTLIGIVETIADVISKAKEVLMIVFDYAVQALKIIVSKVVHSRVTWTALLVIFLYEIFAMITSILDWINNVLTLGGLLGGGREGRTSRIMSAVYAFKSTIKSCVLMFTLLVADIAVLALLIHFLDAEKIKLATEALINIIEAIGEFMKVVLWITAAIGLVVVFVEGFKMLAKLHGKVKDTAKKVKADIVGGLKAIGGIILAMALAFISLSASMAILDYVNPDRLGLYCSIMLGMMTVMTAVVVSLMAASHKFSQAAKIESAFSLDLSPQNIIDVFRKGLDAESAIKFGITSPLGETIGLIFTFAMLMLAFSASMKILDSLKGSAGRILLYAGIMVLMVGAVTACIMELMRAAGSLANVFDKVSSNSVMDQFSNRRGTGRKRGEVNDSVAKNEYEHEVGSGTADVISAISSIVRSVAILFLAIAASMKILDLVKNKGALIGYTIMFAALGAGITLMLNYIFKFMGRYAEAIKGVTNMNYAHKALEKNPIAEIITSISFMILSIAAALSIISAFPVEKMAISGVILSVTLGIILVMLAAIFHFYKWLSSRPSVTNAKIEALKDISKLIKAISVFAIAVSTSLFIISAATMAFSYERVWSSVFAVAGVILGLSVGLKIIISSINNMVKNAKGVKFGVIVGTVIALVALLGVLTVAITVELLALSALNFGNMIAAAVSVSVLLISMSILVWAMSTIVKGLDKKSIAAMIVTFIGLSAIIFAMSQFIKSFSILITTVDIGKVAASMAKILLALAVVELMVAIIAGISQKWSQVGAIAAVFIGMAIIFQEMSGMIKEIVALDGVQIKDATDNIARIIKLIMGLTGIISAVSVIIGIFSFMGTLGKIAAGAAIVTLGMFVLFVISMAELFRNLAIAMQSMAITLSVLSNIDDEQLGSVDSIYDMFIAIGKAIFELSGYAVKSFTGMLALSIEVSMLANGLNKLASLDVTKIIRGATVFNTVLDSFGNALVNNSDIPAKLGEWMTIFERLVNLLPVLAIGIALGTTSLLIAVVELMVIGVLMLIAGEKAKEGLIYFLDVVLGDLADMLIERAKTIGMELAAALILWGLIVGIGGAVFAVGSFAFMLGALEFLVGVMALYESINALELLGDKIQEFYSKIMPDEAGLRGLAALINLLGGPGTSLLAAAGIIEATEEDADQDGTSWDDWWSKKTQDFLDGCTEATETMQEAMVTGASAIDQAYRELFQKPWVGVGYQAYDMYRDAHARDSWDYEDYLEEYYNTGNHAVKEASRGARSQQSNLSKTMYEVAKFGTNSFRQGIQVIGKISSDAMKEATEESKASYEESFKSMAEDGIDAFTEKVTEKRSAIRKAVEETTQDSSESSETVIEGIANGVDTVVDNAIEGSDDFIDRMRNKATGIINFLQTVIGINPDDVSTIRSTASDFWETVKGVFTGEADFSSIKDWLADKLPDIFGDSGILAGDSLMNGLMNAIMGAAPAIERVAGSIAANLREAFGWSRLAADFEQFAFADNLSTDQYRIFHEMYLANRSSFASRGLNTEEDVWAWLKSDTPKDLTYERSDWESWWAEYMAGLGGSGTDFEPSDISGTANLASETSAALDRGTNINSNNVTTNNYNYTQNNYSPEPLDRLTIYQQTEYALGMYGHWNNQ